MTANTNFNTKITTAPIYSIINTNQSAGQQIHSDWQKWFQQLHTQLSANSYLGQPSTTLNSDFYWNNGIPSSITQGSGDNEFFSEKWQVFGATSATYTISRHPFDGNNEDQTGSDIFVNVQVSAYNGQPFYIFQRLTGSEFVRRFQARNIQSSAKIFGDFNNGLALNFSVFVEYGSTTKEFMKGTYHTQGGIEHFSSLITTQEIGDIIVSGTPFVEFRMYITPPDENNYEFNLIYFKSEIGDIPTPLVIDHPLERARIDNS